MDICSLYRTPSQTVTCGPHLTARVAGSISDITMVSPAPCPRIPVKTTPFAFQTSTISLANALRISRENTAKWFNGMTFLQYRNRGYRSENASFEFDEIEEPYNRTSDEDENNIEYYEDVDFEIDDFDFSRKPERGNRYELKIRTFVPDGLLLWRSKNRNMAEDYLSVAIVDGYPEFSFNLGLRNTFWAIRSKIRVDDGEWHTIQVRRRKRVGFISVDGHPSIKGIARNGAISLRTNSKLWIGGTTVLPPNLPSAYYKGFDGCIKQILVNAKSLDLLANNDLSKIHFCHDNEI
nr:unnamed protein product [Callosobruchus chinensis]